MSPSSKHLRAAQYYLRLSIRALTLGRAPNVYEAALEQIHDALRVEAGLAEMAEAALRGVDAGVEVPK